MKLSIQFYLDLKATSLKGLMIGASQNICSNDTYITTRIVSYSHVILVG